MSKKLWLPLSLTTLLSIGVSISAASQVVREPGVVFIGDKSWEEQSHGVVRGIIFTIKGVTTRGEKIAEEKLEWSGKRLVWRDDKVMREVFIHIQATRHLSTVGEAEGQVDYHITLDNRMEVLCFEPITRTFAIGQLKTLTVGAKVVKKLAAYMRDIEILKDPLFIVINENNTEQAKALIASTSKAGNINKQTNAGGTALHIAVEKGNAEIVKALIAAGADVNKPDNDGRPALHMAAEKHFSGIGSLAAKNNNLEIIKALFAAGADVNKPDRDGRTALRIAIENGNLEIVKALIADGAEVNKQYKDGKTALSIAKDAETALVGIVNPADRNAVIEILQGAGAK